MEQLLSDAYHGRLQPLYNFLNDLPDLRGQVMPFLPPEVVRRSFVHRHLRRRPRLSRSSAASARSSTSRDANPAIATPTMWNAWCGPTWPRASPRFFITDDDFARNKNWEAIFDRLIALREQEGWIHLKLMIQVDTQCHKVPRFIEKAVRAGCTRVFIGLESVNPENLAASRKHQNHVDEYRTMLQAWRSREVLTQAGYILGFPADTPESIERDIRTIQRELPVDILEFFMLTPLPGLGRPPGPLSPGQVDGPGPEPLRHRARRRRAPAHERGGMASDLRPCLAPVLQPRARGNAAAPCPGRRHPDQAPRRGDLHVLRQPLLRESPSAPGRRFSAQGSWHAPAGDAAGEPAALLSRRAWQIVTTYARGALYFLWLQRLRRKVERDPAAAAYTDAAIAGFDRGTVGGRHAKRLLDRDPIEAQDRAKRNEEALAVLEHRAQERAQAARRHRTPLAIALAPDSDRPAKQQCGVGK